MTDQTRRLLDWYTDYLLVSFGQATATGLAALLPDVVSHDKVTRFLSQNEFTNKDLTPLRFPRPTMSKVIPFCHTHETRIKTAG